MKYSYIDNKKRVTFPALQSQRPYIIRSWLWLCDTMVPGFSVWKTRMNKLAYELAEFKQKRPLEKCRTDPSVKPCVCLTNGARQAVCLLLLLFFFPCAHWVAALHKEPPRFLCITFSLALSTCWHHQPHFKSSQQSMNNIISAGAWPRMPSDEKCSLTFFHSNRLFDSQWN